MLETAILSLGMIKVTLNIAFAAGSSTHGNALLASVASNCVTAMIFSVPSISVYVDL